MTKFLQVRLNIYPQTLYEPFKSIVFDSQRKQRTVLSFDSFCNATASSPGNLFPRGGEGKHRLCGRMSGGCLSLFDRYIRYISFTCFVAWRNLMTRSSRTQGLRWREQNIAWIDRIHALLVTTRRGLMRSSPDRAVRVRVLVRNIVLCSWARHFTLTVPLSTQVYKWVPVNLTLGVTLRWTSIPSRGSRNTPSHFTLQKPEISASPMGHLACMQTFRKQCDNQFGGNQVETTFSPHVMTE